MSEGHAEEKFQLETSDNSVVITCPEQLDISVVNELHTLLNEQIGQCTHIEFDTGKVERADAAVLQLLTVFSRDAKARSITVKWRNTSNIVINAAKLLGLQYELGLDSAS